MTITRIKSIILAPIILVFLCLLFMVGCTKKENAEQELRTKSFAIIEELCDANFAPSTKEQYENTYQKYLKQENIISEYALTQFFDYPNKDVKTNITMTDYKCNYVISSTGAKYYEARLTLTHKDTGLYSKIKVVFHLENGLIYQVYIFNDNY